MERIVQKGVLFNGLINDFDLNEDTLLLPGSVSETTIFDLSDYTDAVKTIFQFDNAGLALEGITMRQLVENGSLAFEDGSSLILDTDDSHVINRTGTATSDRVLGRGGDDNIIGGGGGEFLQGNTGNDVIKGNVGEDTIHGGQGNDKVYGGQGNDVLFGDLGNDTLSGGTGNDIFAIIVDPGSTDIITDSRIGIDRIDISAFTAIRTFEQLTIEDSANGAVVTLLDGQTIIIEDRAAADVKPGLFYFAGSSEALSNKSGNNETHNPLSPPPPGTSSPPPPPPPPTDETLFATSANDNLVGSSLNTNFVINNAGDFQTGDTFDGGAGGNNVLTFKAGGSYNLNSLTAAQLNNVLTIYVDGNQNITITLPDHTGLTYQGGTGSDYVIAGALNETIHGGAGDDVIDYSASSAVVTFDLTAGTASSANTGTDQITGFETFMGSATSSNNFTGADGDHHFVGGNAIDIVNTGDGDNTIEVGEGMNQVTTGNGNNIITAGDGVNTVNTGSGDDIITLGDGGNTIHAESGDNQITTGAGDDVVTTTNGNQTINAGDGNNNITTGNGTNDITAGDGVNTITTGEGDDTVTVGSGDNTIDAGNGNNIVNAGSGDNNITVGSGSDNIYLTSGADNVTLAVDNSADKIYLSSLAVDSTTGNVAAKTITGFKATSAKATGVDSFAFGGDFTDPSNINIDTNGDGVLTFDTVSLPGSAIDFATNEGIIIENPVLSGGVDYYNDPAKVASVLTNNLTVGETAGESNVIVTHNMFEKKATIFIYTEDGIDTNSVAQNELTLIANINFNDLSTVNNLAADDFSLF